MYFRYHGVKEAEPDPFDQLIFKLGKRHEQTHVNSLGEYLDISELPREKRIENTREAIGNGTEIIYQGMLRAEESIGGHDVEIIGIPDVLIKEGSSYIIRDCKLARHAEENRHPEILAQIRLFGYLFEKTTGMKPARLEAFLGDDSLVDITYSQHSALESLTTILRLVTLKEEPYSPVGWSKCLGCGFRESCWGEAEKEMSVALLPAVDQGLARTFREEGIKTYVEVLEQYDEATLSELKRPYGRTLRKVGKSAGSVILQAQAMKEKRNILIAKPELPKHPNLVMFDVEGLPPYLDELDKIYLWGLQVYGENSGTFLPALAPFGPEGDKQGWEAFLANCRGIFNEHGDISFVHWHSYEKTKMKLYMERHGDTDGIAQRVLDNLLDLHRVTTNAIVLPEPSYSLKVVERVAGFERTQDEYGGTWSIAKYIEAVETDDPSVQKEIINQILKYNEEDLAGTWEVYKWLKEQINA